MALGRKPTGSGSCLPTPGTANALDFVGLGLDAPSDAVTGLRFPGV